MSEPKLAFQINVGQLGTADTVPHAPTPNSSALIQDELLAIRKLIELANEDYRQLCEENRQLRALVDELEAKVKKVRSAASQ